MNTQLTDDRRVSTVAQRDANTVISRSRPPNPLEQLALRIGIALIIWGRRGKRLPDRSESIRRYESRFARESREREFQRNWLFDGSRR